METILINWLREYTNVNNIHEETTFSELNFDIFDEAMTVNFVKKKFNKDINRELWFINIKELLDDLHRSS